MKYIIAYMGLATVAIAGVVPMGSLNIMAVYPHVRASRLRALAVASAQRAVGAPGISTMTEASIAGIEIETGRQPYSIWRKP